MMSLAIPLIQLKRGYVNGGGDQMSEAEAQTILLSVAEVAKRASISRSMAYKEVASGNIPSVRIGTAVRVPEQALARWIEANTRGDTVHEQDKVNRLSSVQQ